MHVRAEIPKGIENMSRMLVIGNGFDKAHKLPTGYDQFQAWLKQEDPDLLERMATYFPEVVDESLEWWRDFENNLDKIDAHDEIQRIVQENYPNFASDDFRDADYHAASIEIEEQMKAIYRDIQEKFEIWIESLDLNCQRIFNILGYDFFLSFNYTDTLQEIYGIHPNRILYIHGQANVSDRLVIGHNSNPEHYKLGIESVMPEPPTNLDPDELYEWCEENADDYITQSTRQAAKAVVNSFKKPTEEIMNMNRIFFGRVSQLKEISFYGFSFAEVDMPYIFKIANFSADNAVWKIYYFTDNDYQRVSQVKELLSKYKLNVEILQVSSFPSYDSIQQRIPGL